MHEKQLEKMIFSQIYQSVELFDSKSRGHFDSAKSTLNILLYQNQNESQLLTKPLFLFW